MQPHKQSKSPRLFLLSMHTLMLCCGMALTHYGTKAHMEFGDYVMGTVFSILIISLLKLFELEYAELRRYKGQLKVKTIQHFNPNMPPQNIQVKSKVGYVYLLSALHDSSLYKIGRTNNPNNRLHTFSVKLPFAVEYLCVIQTDDMYLLERQLHGKYSSKRLEGEWFKLDLEDVDYIKGLANA